MKKYFLFRKEEVSITSSTLDDTGDTVSVFAVPADSLAFVSSEVGKVLFVFNDATIYEESNLTDGESMKKASIEVECDEGGEFDLVEQVLGFLSREDQPGRNIMKFDAVGVSTFNSKTPVVKSPKKPIKRITQEPSSQTFIGSSDAFTASLANVIAGVDFEDASNLPLVDYNATATDFNGFSDNAEITSWKNDIKATGGTAYDITSNVGTPKIAYADTFFGTKYVDSLASGGAVDYFVVPEINISGPYTLYFVHHASPVTSSTIPPAMYADEEGDCFGFLKKSTKNTFELRHDGVAGSAVTGKFSIPYPDPNYDPNDASSVLNGVQPFVIRRDRGFNISIYNWEGSLAAYIPAVLGGKTSVSSELAPYVKGATISSDGRTDGDLKITRLGDGADGSTTSSKAYWSRFGVIAKDVGADLCANIARQLYDHYQP